MGPGPLLGALAAAGAVWGGARVLRARWAVDWRPPGGRRHDGALHARLLDGDRRRPIVLLHGLLGSGAYWGAAFDALAVRGQLIVPDLLGHGRSPRPAAGYGPADHADAVRACLDEVGAAGPATVAGHSLGGLVALHLAARHPAAVAAVVAFAPALYRDRAGARRHVRRMAPFTHPLALSPTLGPPICRWHERHPAAAARTARILRPDLPAEIARDAVAHSWASYAETLERVLVETAGDALPGRLSPPVRLVAGGSDRGLDLSFLRELAARHPAVSLDVWPRGGHGLPLTHPAECRATIEATLPPP